jgi:hypothetical protein
MPELQAIADLISKLGFPTVVALWLLYQNYVIDQRTRASHQNMLQRLARLEGRLCPPYRPENSLLKG